MHNVFISYHHENDQLYKNSLVKYYGTGDNRIFNDGSVDTGDIADNLTDEQIRTKIRDEYLKNTTVTIVLVGKETKNRKHIDWEIYSSMFDGTINKKSGILVVLLPSVDNGNAKIAHDNEKEVIYPEPMSWTSVETRAEYERRYPYLSDRLIDNLLQKEAKISVVSWDKFYNNKEKLQFLIEVTANDRAKCEYDMSRPMKRANS
jgi:hypothetical protein